MIQTDKERLAISTAIALLLYAGIFAATGWLNILNPAEPREYIGPLTVAVTLQKPEPQTILPPEVEKPEPEVEPKVETTPVEPPINEPVTPEVTVPSRPESSPPSAESTGTTGQPAAESPAAAAPESQQAVVVETHRYYGESETVSAPAADIGREFFESVREETPSDLRGETTIEYGSDIAPDNPRVGTLNSNADTDESSLIDLSQLDNLPVGVGERGIGDGDGNGAEGNSFQQAAEPIEAYNIAELMTQRKVIRQPLPDTSDLSLPNGATSMEVWVEFKILKNGNVQTVSVSDTGDPNLNVRIRQKLLNWKFEAIQQDMSQTARLLINIKVADETVN